MPGFWFGLLLAQALAVRSGYKEFCVEAACPDGFHALKDPDSCKDAQESLSKDWAGERSEVNTPHGCNSVEGDVWFNTHNDPVPGPQPQVTVCRRSGGRLCPSFTVAVICEMDSPVGAVFIFLLVFCLALFVVPTVYFHAWSGKAWRVNESRIAGSNLVAILGAFAIYLATRCKKVGTCDCGVCDSSNHEHCMLWMWLGYAFGSMTLLCYLLVVLLGPWRPNHAKNPCSPNEFLTHVEMLRGQAPKFSFVFECYDGVRLYRSATDPTSDRWEPVLTHRSHARFPVNHFVDETDSPERFLAQWSPGSVVFIDMQLKFSPGDTQTQRAYDTFRGDFFAANTRDRYRAEDWCCTLADYKPELSVSVHSDRDEKTMPWWTSSWAYLLAAACLAVAPLKAYICYKASSARFQVEKKFYMVEPRMPAQLGPSPEPTVLGCDTVLPHRVVCD